MIIVSRFVIIALGRNNSIATNVYIVTFIDQSCNSYNKRLYVFRVVYSLIKIWITSLELKSQDIVILKIWRSKPYRYLFFYKISVELKIKGSSICFKV